MSTVEELCGVYPEDFEKLDISSNPNFVFTNDPNYPAKQLFDADSNKISVNSFVECEHYVSGGWNFTPVTSSEFLLQDNLIYISLVLLVLTFLRPKLVKVFKN
jgi:hypothetical protein